MDPKKIEYFDELDVCIEQINTKQFYKVCLNTCKQINLSRISSIVDGDYEFLNQAVQTLNFLFNMGETGNLMTTYE